MFCMAARSTSTFLLFYPGFFSQAKDDTNNTHYRITSEGAPDRSKDDPQGTGTGDMEETPKGGISS